MLRRTVYFSSFNVSYSYRHVLLAMAVCFILPLTSLLVKLVIKYCGSLTNWHHI